MGSWTRFMLVILGGRYINFRINTLKANINEVMKELNKNKIKAVNCSFVKNAFIAKGAKEKL